MGIMDPSEIQSTWFAFISRLGSFFRVLKKVSLFWHHPFALVFVLLLFTSPMQPVIGFFFPLIICTLICIAAFIGFTSMMEKSREGERHGGDIAWLDVLGLHADDFQPHSPIKQEADFDQLMEEMKSKATLPIKDGVLDVDQQGKDGNTSLKEEIEPEKESSGVPKPQPDSSPKSSCFTDGAVKKERKLHVKFKEEIVVIDDQGRDSGFLRIDDHDDADLQVEDADLRASTGEMKKSQSYDHMKDGTSTLDEQVKSGLKGCGLQEDSDLKFKGHTKDDLCCLAEETKESAELEDANGGKEVELNCSSDHESTFEVNTQVIERKLNCMDDCRKCSKYEDDLQNQEVGCDFQIDGDAGGTNVVEADTNVMNMLVHDQTLAGEMFDRPPGDDQTNEKGEPKAEIEPKVQVEDKTYGIVGLSHELQPYRSLKEEGSPSQGYGLAPQKWREWVRNVEIAGLRNWSLEKGIFRIAKEKTNLTDFNEQFSGVATNSEDFMVGGAFAAEDDNGGTLLWEVSAYIQQVSARLQDESMIEEELEQPIGRILSANAKESESRLVNNIRDFMLDSYSTRVETIDDLRTEEGDESSRWDEALDTTEKESMESENDEGMVWTSMEEATEFGEPITEQEFQALKQKYHALERDLKALQDEIRLRSLEQKSCTIKSVEYDSDGSLDPYIRLFAEAASDAEDKLQNPPQQIPKSSTKVPSRMGSNSKDYTTHSSLDTKAFLRKPRICGIKRIIRAMRGKKALNWCP